MAFLGNIPYYTDRQFNEEYLQDPDKLELTEMVIEEDYKTYLTSKCAKEKSKKSLGIHTATKFNKNKLPAANAMTTPSCDLYSKYFDSD